MKQARQKAILEIIASTAVETQEDLQSLLIQKGFDVTQATVSRDIRELGLIKSNTDEGYRYLVGEAKKAPELGEKFTRIFAEAARSVDSARNLIVVKSYPGMGPAMGTAIDNMRIEGIVGTLAGDDTLLIISHDDAKAVELANALTKLIKVD